MARSDEPTVMTSYGLGIAFSDEEILALRRALDHYLDRCREQGKKNDEDWDFFVVTRRVVKRIETELRARPKRPHGFGFLESEMHRMKAALASYLELCEKKIAQGVTLPFTAERAIVKAISARIPEEFIRGVMEADAELAAGRNADEVRFT